MTAHVRTDWTRNKVIRSGYYRRLPVKIKDMISETELQRWTQQIVTEFHPERVILFGSYAAGHPTAQSDVDLLVVMPFEGHPVKMAAKIRKALGHLMQSIQRMDILVRTPHEMDYRLGYGDTFFSNIVQQGRTLYERHPGS